MTRQANWNQRENANKCVNVYWAPSFVEEIDEVCQLRKRKRNDFIKQAVLEKLRREQQRLGIIKSDSED